jgi:hypothetical protein
VQKANAIECVIYSYFYKKMDMRRLTLFIAAAMLFAGNAMAQLSIDTSKVIQVSQEPRHHKVFENEWVRILDVRIPPHDTSLIHKHTTPSVFIVLGNTKSGAQTFVEPRHKTFSKEGIWYEEFNDTPRIHRVWNEDTIDFHVVDMEILHKSPSTDMGAAPASSNLLFDERLVRANRVTMPAHQSFRVRGESYPVVVVGLSGPNATGSVNGKAFSKKGDYLFVPAGTELGISNENGTGDVQFVVFRLK